MLAEIAEKIFRLWSLVHEFCPIFVLLLLCKKIFCVEKLAAVSLQAAFQLTIVRIGMFTDSVCCLIIPLKYFMTCPRLTLEGFTSTQSLSSSRPAGLVIVVQLGCILLHRVMFVSKSVATAVPSPNQNQICDKKFISRNTCPCPRPEKSFN